MKTKYIVFLAFLFMLAYLFLSGLEIGSELTFRPVWSSDLTKASQKNQSSDPKPVGFTLSGGVGYVGRDGIVTYFDKILSGIALGEDFFINYSNIDRNLIIRKVDGSIVSSAARKGFPWISGKRLFLISDDGNGISSLEGDGNILWEKWFSSPVTTMDASEDYLLAGFLDGYAVLLNTKGEIVWQFYPETSKIAVIYGCAISESGKRIALLSGLDPQRLTVLEKKDGDYKTVINKITDTSFKRTVFLSFSGNYFFMEGDNRIYFSEKGKKWLKSLEIKGRLTGFLNSGTSDLFYIFSRNGDRTWMNLFNPPQHLFMETAIPDNNIFKTVRDNSLFLGIDHNLLRVDLLEQ